MKTKVKDMADAASVLSGRKGLGQGNNIAAGDVS